MSELAGLGPWAIVFVLVSYKAIPAIADVWKARTGRRTSDRPTGNPSGNGALSLAAHIRQMDEVHSVVTRTNEVGTPLLFAQGERQSALLERIADAVERREQ